VAQAFADFYAAHFGALTVQLYAFTGDMSEAQDVVQEAFCRAWPRWDRLVAYDDPVAWVRRVAWNVATSRWRRGRTALNFLARQRPEVIEGPGPDRVAVTVAMARLPVRHRRVVALYYLAGLTTAEIAQECDVAEGTVRSWLHRARAVLLAQLADRPEGVTQ
jgi:RNA polymerase sigma-70 factor (ECF subfamily)